MVTKTVTSAQHLLGRQGLLPTPPIPEDLPCVELTENARQVLVRRFVRRGDDGEPVETPEEMFWRMAYHIAKAEEAWGGDVMAVARDYYALLTGKKFFPNSPTFTGAGTPLGQLAACFVLAISDDMGRDPAGIFQSLRDAALIQQTGGGNGFSFSRLRPKGSLVKSSAGQATGPVGFLRVYDHAFGEIAQGGTRRGANMGVLRVDHPDIEDFITCKTDENQITNFNISVGITDAFMRAVRDNAEWELRFPDVNSPEYRSLSGTLEQAEQADVPIHVYRKVRARELFDKIVRQAHHNGEPGMLFLDAANRLNPVPHLYPLEATNPCVTGETLVAVADGRGAVSIRELAIEGRDIPVYCQGPNGITIRWGRKPRKTRTNFPVFKITLDDGSTIRSTADHRFMLRDGTCKRLLELQPGNSLMPFNKYQYTQSQKKDCLYWAVLLNQPGSNITWAPEHRLIMEFVIGKEIRYPDQVVHHKDYNGLNNSWSNLEVMTVTDHDALHRERMLGDNNPMRSRWWEQLTLEEQVDYRRQMSNLVTGEKNPRYGVTLLDDLRERIKSSVNEYWSDPARHSEHGQSIHAAMTDEVRAKISAARIAPRETRKCANPDCDQAFEVTSGSLQRYHDHTCSTIAGRETYASNAPDRHTAVRAAQVELGTALKTELGRLPLKSEFMQIAEERDINPHVGYYWQDYNAFLDALENANHRVVSVEFDGNEDVYNITVDEFHNLAYITNRNGLTRAGQVRWSGVVTANCGEQWLGPYENCCLGSVNLAEHCVPEGGVDWDSLRRSVELSTRFLDNVVDANAYVPAVPQLKEAAHKARRIGLGIMGLADLMYHVGVRYGSEEGQEFGAQVMEFVRYHAMRTSIQLAKERQAFPAIKGSIYDPDDLTWTPPQPLAPYTRDWGRPHLDWEEILEGIRRHGIRNAAQTTVAPTGTIATVAGCEGYGCEPVFALAYVRHVNDNGKDLQLTYASPRFEAALAAAGVNDAARRKIIERVMENGSCQDISEVPESIRHTFVVSADICAEEHVRMQAAMQSFVDNSISKTVNFPETATEEDVAKAYLLAWELGCKGITVYVTGSREKVVLETKATAEKKQGIVVENFRSQVGDATRSHAGESARRDLSADILATQLAAWHESKKPRPRALVGRTYRVETPLGKAFITVNENGDGHPFEVFLNTAKAGSETAAVSEAIGRLISYVLRLASPIAPRDRLAEVVKQLSGIGGGRSLGFGPHRVRSLPDGVGQVLNEYLRGETDPDVMEKKTSGNGHFGEETLDELPRQMSLKMGDLCPECGEATMVNEEGCRKCYTCGYSEC